MAQPVLSRVAEIPVSVEYEGTLVWRVIQALAVEPPEKCPITDDPPSTRHTMHEVPPDLRGLLTLWAELKANHSAADEGIAWTWKSNQIESVRLLLFETLRQITPGHKRIYIQPCKDWQYAAVWL